MNLISVRLASVLFAAAFMMAPLSVPAAGADCSPVVSDGWVRMPPMAMPMLAGFGTIKNDCTGEVTIVAASSEGFADVSVHETRFEDGMARMREVPKLVVPAGGAVTLAPGGLHLMLMQPDAPVEAGDTVEIDFQLEDGGVIRGRFEVRK